MLVEGHVTASHERVHAPRRVIPPSVYLSDVVDSSHSTTSSRSAVPGLVVILFRDFVVLCTLIPTRQSGWRLGVVGQLARTRQHSIRYATSPAIFGATLSKCTIFGPFG